MSRVPDDVVVSSSGSASGSGEGVRQGRRGARVSGSILPGAVGAGLSESRSSSMSIERAPSGADAPRKVFNYALDLVRRRAARRACQADRPHGMLLNGLLFVSCPAVVCGWYLLPDGCGALGPDYKARTRCRVLVVLS